MVSIIKVDYHKGDGKSGWYHSVWTAVENIRKQKVCFKFLHMSISL